MSRVKIDKTVKIGFSSNRSEINSGIGYGLFTMSPIFMACLRGLCCLSFPLPLIRQYALVLILSTLFRKFICNKNKHLQKKGKDAIRACEARKAGGWSGGEGKNKIQNYIFLPLCKTSSTLINGPLGIYGRMMLSCGNDCGCSCCGGGGKAIS